MASDGQTNLVTSSLLELLITAKNDYPHTDRHTGRHTGRHTDKQRDAQ